MQFLRFTKFVDIKQFFFDNEDIYNAYEKDYFPSKVLNIDSVLLAFSINLFIYNFISARFPEKKSFCDSIKDLDCDIKIVYDGIPIILVLIIPLYLTYFVLAIFDILNDNKLSHDYDKLIYNWNLNPIKSINSSISSSSYYYDYYYDYDDYYYSRNTYKNEISNNFALGNDTLRLEKFPIMII